jgi:hypothetical protein
MRKIAGVLLLALWPGVLAGQNTPPAPAPVPADYSGMYAFLQEGEFVQLTVEDDGRVTGFVSRYGESESDHGAFLDQFFKEAKLDGAKLHFTTQTVHGVWYEFKGAIERGEGKNPGDESYYLLKGALTQFTTDANKKVSSKARTVALKAFPHDLDQPLRP